MSNIVKVAENVRKYGSMSLLPQVDPDVIEPILESEFKKLSFYSPEDHLALWKNKKTDLRFQYSSKQPQFTEVHGTIYAQEPRESF